MRTCSIKGGETLNDSNFDKEFDARGLACPLPIIKARQEINSLGLGQILKVVCTDRGSLNDFKGWAKSAKNLEIVDQKTEPENGREVYIHFLKRTA